MNDLMTLLSIGLFGTWIAVGFALGLRILAILVKDVVKEFQKE